MVRRRLEQAAWEWVHSGYDKSYLYGGTRLKEAQLWARDHSDDLGGLGQDFLNASAVQAKQDRVLRVIMAILPILIGVS